MMASVAPGIPSIAISETRDAMGRAAASDIAAALRDRLARQDRVRMVFAAAPSQAEMLEALASERDIDWRRVIAFHMDEYLGLPAHAPERFGVLADPPFLLARPSGRRPSDRTGIRSGPRSGALHRPSGGRPDRHRVPRHRRQRSSGVQRSARRGFARHQAGQDRRARRDLPSAAGRRQVLCDSERRPDTRDHPDDPPAAGRPSAILRGARRGQARRRRAIPVRPDWRRLSGKRVAYASAMHAVSRPGFRTSRSFRCRRRHAHERRDDTCLGPRSGDRTASYDHHHRWPHLRHRPRRCR